MEGGGGVHGHRWPMCRTPLESHKHDDLVPQFGAHDAPLKENTGNGGPPMMLNSHTLFMCLLVRPQIDLMC